MKLLFIKGALLSFAMITGFQSFSQFTLEGQYRPRFEYRDGFKTPIKDHTPSAAFTEQRTRLTAGYKSEKIGFKLSIQDVRIWGETGHINKSDALLSAHEAYAEYFASTKSTFRIGRQEIRLDGDRFVGSLDWAAQARSFDALRYLYSDTSGNEITAMLAFNQNGTPSEPTKLTGNSYSGTVTSYTGFNLNLPKAQQMLTYKKTLSPGNSISFMALNDVQQPVDSLQNVYSRYTLGLTPEFKKGDLKFGGQFYYTGGELSKTTKVSAYMFNVHVQHEGIFGKPELGVDYLSGEDGKDTKTLNGFNPLYGTNHAFYGFMDYFYVGNGHAVGGNKVNTVGGAHDNAGLIDIFLKTTFKTGEKSKLLAHLHYFSSPVELKDKDGSTVSSGLGTEIDLVYVKPLAEGVKLNIGYSQMFATDGMKAVKYGDTSVKTKGMQNWAWVMIDFTPKFLK